MMKGKTPRMLFVVLLALTNERGRGQERTYELFHRFVQYDHI